MLRAASRTSCQSLATRGSFGAGKELLPKRGAGLHGVHGESQPCVEDACDAQPLLLALEACEASRLSVSRSRARTCAGYASSNTRTNQLVEVATGCGRFFVIDAGVYTYRYKHPRGLTPGSGERLEALELFVARERGV